MNSSFFFILLITIQLSGGFVFSQFQDSLKDRFKERQPFLNVLKINPLPIVWGSVPFTSEYRVVLEYVTGSQQSSQVSIAYLAKNWMFKLDTSVAAEGLIIRGFRFQGTFKFYMNNSMPVLANLINDNPYAPLGPYLAPHVSFATAKITYDYWNSRYYYIRGNQFNVALLAGYQFTILNVIAVDLFTGLGYKNNEWITREANKITKIDLRKELGDGWLIRNYVGPIKTYLGFNIGVVY
ncbi:MAG: hypothetical protein HYY40_02025 [Bacteroidetes bacterium]|nr:hypothetical protein [Bacteroidota bacterium]